MTETRENIQPNPKNWNKLRNVLATNGTSSSTNGISLSPRPSSNPEDSASQRQNGQGVGRLQELSSLKQRRIHRHSQSRESHENDFSSSSRSEEISPILLINHCRVPSLFNTSQQEPDAKPVIDVLHQTDRKIKELEDKWEALKRSHLFLAGHGNSQEEVLSSRSEQKNKNYEPMNPQLSVGIEEWISSRKELHLKLNPLQRKLPELFRPKMPYASSSPAGKEEYRKELKELGASRRPFEIKDETAIKEQNFGRAKSHGAHEEDTVVSPRSKEHEDLSEIKGCVAAANQKGKAAAVKTEPNNSRPESPRDLIDQKIVKNAQTPLKGKHSRPGSSPIQNSTPKEIFVLDKSSIKKSQPKTRPNSPKEEITLESFLKKKLEMKSNQCKRVITTEKVQSPKIITTKSGQNPKAHSKSNYKLEQKPIYTPQNALKSAKNSYFQFPAMIDSVMKPKKVQKNVLKEKNSKKKPESLCSSFRINENHFKLEEAPQSKENKDSPKPNHFQQKPYLNIEERTKEDKTRILRPQPGLSFPLALSKKKVFKPLRAVSCDPNKQAEKPAEKPSVYKATGGLKPIAEVVHVNPVPRNPPQKTQCFFAEAKIKIAPQLHTKYSDIQLKLKKARVQPKPQNKPDRQAETPRERIQFLESKYKYHSNRLKQLYIGGHPQIAQKC